MTYKSILCLNGDIPPKDFFDGHPLPLIAADGAANKLQALGLRPSIVVGDLDSLDTSLDFESHQVQDQRRGDYEKSLAYLEKNALLPTIVVGIGGGDLDHVLNNISVFMLGPPGNLLVAPPLYGMILHPSYLQITLPIHTKLSLVGLPQARVITKGLMWDLTGQQLRFPGVNSCLNQMKKSAVYLHILEGQVLFLAHGVFFKKQVDIWPPQ